MMRLTRHERGFTLLEVLAVVSIIATLLAILMPSLGRAKIEVMRAACLSNLNQLGKAWQLYFDANQDRFLRAINADINYGGRQGRGAAAFGSDPNKPVPKPSPPGRERKDAAVIQIWLGGGPTHF